MKVYLDSYHSQKLGKTVNKIGINGTSKYLLLNDDELNYLANLISLGAKNERTTDC